MKYVISKQVNLNKIKHFFNEEDVFTINSLTFFDILMVKDKTPILYNNNQNEIRFVKSYNKNFISIYPGFYHDLDIHNKNSIHYSIFKTENTSDFNIRTSFKEYPQEKLDKLKNISIDNLNKIIKNKISNYNHYNSNIEFEYRINNDDVLILGEPLTDKKNNNKLNDKLFNILNKKGKVYYLTHQENLVEIKKRKCISSDKIEEYNIFDIEEININPYNIINKFKTVIVKNSYLGFIALLLNKEVHCLTETFYSGYGLTIDHYNSKEENINRSLLDIFTYSHIVLPIYSSPINQKKVSFSKFLNDLIKLKNINERNDKNFYLFGFSLWKQKHIKRYLKNINRKNNVKFLNEVTDFDLFDEDNVEFVFWGKKDEYLDIISFANSFSIPCSFMEDGFIRSLSLGSDLTESLSLSLDNKNIYYDYSEPSELEDMINNKEKDEFFNIKSIKNFIELKNNNEITKYNSPIVNFNKPLVKNRDNYSKVIFIPGQVDNDLSIKLGTKEKMNNLDLIKKVREENPEAFIIYKIHPDILSKNRKGSLSILQIKKYVNKVIKERSIFDCFKEADEVHVLTSLVGLDALIYGKKVVCYGLPFYSNWGLTEDKYNIDRRRKDVTIEELVYNVYFKYPMYLNINYSFTDVNNIMNYIIENRNKTKLSFKTKIVRKIRQILNKLNIIKIN